MQVESIVNRIENYKGFVYEQVRWSSRAGRPCLQVEVRARRGSRGWCSGCGEPGATYDHARARWYEYVPLWGFAVFWVYARRRVNCPRCGVKVEAVPWAIGKRSLSKSYMQFLATWARRLSWQEVATIFRTSWEKVFRSAEWVVSWGLEHRDLRGIGSLGIDEVLWQKVHRYLTVVYQIDAHCRRLLWVGKERTVKTLLRFFRFFGPARSGQITFICSDLWKPYLKVIRRKAGQAVHVLDRFHVVQYLNKALDEVRAQEVKELKKRGKEAILTLTRWCLLKRPENLNPKQEARLADLLRYNLKAVRAYLLKEDFQLLWQSRSLAAAQEFLKRWCTRALRSRIEPVKKVARSIRRHQELLLNWFRARGTISSGPTEGLNNRLKLTLRKAYGFRTFRAAEVALYHSLGALPEPECTHRFC